MGKDFKKLFYCGLVFAQPVALAEEIRREYRSARHLGMGDAGTATATGVDAIFYNPAGMANTNGKMLSEIVLASPQFSLGDDTRKFAKGALGGMGMDGQELAEELYAKPQHVAVQNVSGIAFRKVGFGLLQSIQTDAFVGPDLDTLETTASVNAIARVGAHFSIANGFFNDRLLLGGTLKYVQKAEADVSVGIADAANMNAGALSNAQGRGWATGADLGLIYLLQDGGSMPTLGLVARNIGDMSYHKIESAGKNVRSEKQTIDAGLAFEPGTKNSKSRFAIDLFDVANRYDETIYKRLHLGAELSFKDILGARAGLNQGYPTFGAFFNMKIIKLDAGVYSEELGNKSGDRQGKRYFARILVGWSK